MREDVVYSNAKLIECFVRMTLDKGHLRLNS